MELEQLFIPDRCLTFFVDDTGHEAFKGQPMYGLGGCAVLGRDIGWRLAEPWRSVRRRITGSPDLPLHANKLPAIAKVGDMDAVADFFRTYSFWRFGAVVSLGANLDSRLSAMRVIRLAIEKRFNEIVEATLCKEAKVIFESSHRADPQIETQFRDLKLSRGSKNIPVECFFMPKSAASAGLEVADFVAHAIGRQARHDIGNRGTFLADFCAIFHAVDQKLVSYISIDSAKMDETR
jgi:hypothetical protein